MSDMKKRVVIAVLSSMAGLTILVWIFAFRIAHPEVTETQILLDWWPWFTLAVIFSVVGWVALPPWRKPPYH